MVIVLRVAAAIRVAGAAAVAKLAVVKGLKASSAYDAPMPLVISASSRGVMRNPSVIQPSARVGFTAVLGDGCALCGLGTAAVTVLAVLDSIVAKPQGSTASCFGNECMWPNFFTTKSRLRDVRC